MRPSKPIRDRASISAKVPVFFSVLASSLLPHGLYATRRYDADASATIVPISSDALIRSAHAGARDIVARLLAKAEDIRQGR